MNSLFSAKNNNSKDKNPLADRMRPRTLEDIIGQDHIVGQGRLLRRAIQADRLSSIILYGPPGTGKTSLAAVIANTTKAAFENLNAVLAGVKDIREVIDRADDRFRLYSQRTILFVDEVHRWNKAQQDALLPWVENGTVILVGATTENPFFEVNRALVSRSRIFQLKPLGAEELMETARRALSDKERGYGNWKITFEDGALEHLVEVAGGDARSLLNALELAVETSDWTGSKEQVAGSRFKRKQSKNENNIQNSETTTPATSYLLPSTSSWPPPLNTEIYISLEAAEESIQRRALLYDRDGDYHFDTISAFIKSVRGSDPDAALYWLAKMVRAGEDPKFLFRRMIILASEDVGLADPLALSVVISCAQAFERIGFPEGNFPLAHACLYLATCPKSNSTMAYFDALKEVEKEDAEVPNHLRDASRDKEGFGHGEGYIYPHAYRDHWAAQQYLPSSLRGKTFYNPSVVGYEAKIREEVLQKRELQAAIVLGTETADAELLSWSANAKGREGWFKRLESGRSRLLLKERNLIFDAAKPSRQARVLIPNANDGLLLWESLRRSPEGLTCALVSSEEAKNALLQYAKILDDIERPQIQVAGSREQVAGESYLLPTTCYLKENFDCAEFDHILIRAPRLICDPAELAKSAKPLLAKNANLVLLTSPPALGQRISKILSDLSASAPPREVLPALEQAENAFFAGLSGTEPGFWSQQDILSVFENEGFAVNIREIDQQEERLITEKDLDNWFSPDSRWGAFMSQNLEKAQFSAIKDALSQIIAQGPVLWHWKSVLIRANPWAKIS